MVSWMGSARANQKRAQNGIKKEKKKERERERERKKDKDRRTEETDIKAVSSLN